MHETRGSPLRREGRKFAAGWDGGAWTCVVSGGAGVRIVGGAAGPGFVLWAGRQGRGAYIWWVGTAGPGCNTKLDELPITLLRHKVDVAVISETHLNSRIDNDRISLKGYHTLRRDRNLLATNRSKGGGVATSGSRGGGPPRPWPPPNAKLARPNYVLASPKPASRFT